MGHWKSCEVNLQFLAKEGEHRLSRRIRRALLDNIYANGRNGGQIETDSSVCYICLQKPRMVSPPALITLRNHQRRVGESGGWRVGRPSRRWRTVDKGVTWLSVQIFHTPKFNNSAEQQQWFPFSISLLSYSLILRLQAHISACCIFIGKSHFYSSSCLFFRTKLARHLHVSTTTLDWPDVFGRCNQA